MTRPSPFLEAGPRSSANTLAIIHLSRENLVPVILQATTSEADGYAEGAVINTRFGSFPHSTLIGVPWGSQIRASDVDTGSRGRKRKRTEADEGSNASTPALEDADGDRHAPMKKAVVASSGFIHILQPTPELWTSSLPHRTQVVYTPDYSYILQRIRARPGARLIEAGAGSGSFSHAAIRAVYNGYPDNSAIRKGKVYSYEFNEDRFEKMRDEIHNHGLEGLIELTHRDVYNDGFLVHGASPEAEAIFLDLPAPWEALPHLSRRKPLAKNGDSTTTDDSQWVSPLNPNTSVHICTFSPCIEQVTRTISTMRQLGWVGIEMLEISNKKFHVSRERVGLALPNERGSQQTPYDVAEAVTRLRAIEKRARKFQTTGKSTSAVESMTDSTMEVDSAVIGDENGVGAADNADAPAAGSDSKPWLQGRLSHRAEGELRMHTSYLVFAILPREWSEEDEAAASAKWPCGVAGKVVGALDKATRKQEKRDMLEAKLKAKLLKTAARGTRADGSPPPVA